MSSFKAALEAELAALAASDRLRVCPPVAGLSRTELKVDGQARRSFCSNDYLGLAAHPALAEAAAATASVEGFGASASRLVSGDLPAHRQLEGELATFAGREAALVFPTGYQANLGVVSALAGAEDVIVSDALNHASLIDGCRLSRARVAVYPHGDAAAAERLLREARGARRRLLVTESLFSMDGDAAPLSHLAEAARTHDAVLVVDEAHALGTVGPGGRGLSAAAGVVPDVLVGTLGKALGAAGGFVAGDGPLRALLLNRARTFVFTTALPPPVAAAAGAALRLVISPEGDARRRTLHAHCRFLRSALGELGRAAGTSALQPPGNLAESPVVPFVLGPEARALAISAALSARGIFIPAIRPPTVPAGTARLRITLSAAHTEADLELLVTALAEAIF